MENHFVTPSRGIALKFQGVIDLNELYRQMKMWLEDEGFAKEATVERRYVEKIKPNGKNIEILWQGGKTINDYISYTIKILFNLVGVNETEVQQDNVKRKLYKGNFQIFIIGYVEEGSEKWDSLGPLTRLYRNLIEKKRLQNHIDDLYTYVYDFQEFIRKFINIRT